MGLQTNVADAQNPPKAFSVVIPTYNMSEHLPSLWAGIVNSGLALRANEVLFVDDGSTDETPNVLHALARQAEAAGANLRIVRLSENRGRYEARWTGAREAQTAHLLFLDSRVTLASDFAAQLVAASADYDAINGCVDIDVRRGVFCLYWERSHRAIFARHYRDTVRPVTLTESNFDQYLKGTGVFFCPRAAFLTACEKFEGTDLLSDDTMLMKSMVSTCPITIHPNVRVQWIPRETFGAFVYRIWERGAYFAEYHLFERRGLFFKLFVVEVVLLAMWLALTVAAPILGLEVALGALALLALSTILITRSPLEFIRLVPLHMVIALTFAFGALRGWLVIWQRRRAKT